LETIAPHHLERLIGMAYFFVDDSTFEVSVMTILKCYSNQSYDLKQANEFLFRIDGFIDRVFEKTLKGSTEALYLLANISQT
jgi:hypothetical protein